MARQGGGVKPERISAQEAADRAGVGRTSVLRAVQSGALQWAQSWGGRQLLAADIDRWITAGRPGAEHESSASMIELSFSSGVAHSEIRAAVRKGELPFTGPPRQKRIKIEEFRRWLGKRK
jgi:hypothetical protein